MTNALPPSPRRAGTIRVVVAMALAVAVLAWGISHYWPFATDDAFISFRYSARLLAGEGLTWNDGEYVEGYSNLLWVLSCAAVAATGLDVLDAARLLGIACTLATMWLLVRRFSASSWAAAMLPVILAVVAPIPVWAIGGLESPMVMLLLTGGFLAAERAVVGGRVTTRSLWHAGAWFGLACVTRPDAPLFVACAALGVAWTAWRAGRGARAAVGAAAVLVAIPAAMVLLQLGFRIVYYGDYLPNTARVKLTSGGSLLVSGHAYLRTAFWVFLPVLAPAAGGLLLGLLYAPARGLAAALGLASGLWGLYTLRVGGDIFAAWRILIPGLVPVTLLLGQFLERLSAAGNYARWLAWLTVVSSAGLSLFAARNCELTERATWELWEFDNREVAAVLRTAFAEQQPLLALTAAGALPYYSRLPCLDVLGLCDAQIARDQLRAPAESAFQAAHRRARPEYVLERAPDLMFFDKPVPDDDAGLALLSQPGFEAEYRCVWFRCADRVLHGQAGRVPAGELFAGMWVRLDGKVGVQSEPDRRTIPAWLLGSYRYPPGLRLQPPSEPDRMQQWLLDAAVVRTWLQHRSAARLVDGRLVLEVRDAGEHSLVGLRLPPGRWTPDAIEQAPGLRLTLRAREGEPPLLRQGEGWLVEERHAAGVDLVLTIDASTALPLHLERVGVRRQR